MLCVWMFLGWSLGTGQPIGVLFSGKEYLCSQLSSVANSCLVGLCLHELFPVSFVMFIHILLVWLQLEQLYWGDIMGLASNGTMWHNVTAKPLWLLQSKAGFLMQCSYMHSIGSHNPSLLYGPQSSVAHPPFKPFHPSVSLLLLNLMCSIIFFTSLSLRKLFLF